MDSVRLFIGVVGSVVCYDIAGQEPIAPSIHVRIESAVLHVCGRGE